MKTQNLYSLYRANNYKLVTMAEGRVAGIPASNSQLLLLFLIIFLATFSTTLVEGRGHSISRPTDCRPRCLYRCSATSHKKPCMFFCLKCCSKCLCVPPGTYGNKQTCPCYNNWKTKEGGPKCP